MNGEQRFWLLVFPVVSFFLSGAIAVAAYFKLREQIRTHLDLSRAVRFIFVAVSVILIPLVLGAWSDIVNASQLMQGKISNLDALQLSGLAVLLVFYLFLHGCWFDREEQGFIRRNQEEAELAEKTCQTNYLVLLLENLRACIGRNRDRLSAAIQDSATGRPVIECVSKDVLKDSVRLLLEAARSTYRHVESVPRDYAIKALLLKQNGDYLDHYESYDGSNWDCLKRECDSHREQYFKVDEPNCSVAVASLISDLPFFVEHCDESHRNVDHPFWYFRDCLEHQRREIGSMLAIPVVCDESNRFVLCLTCPKPCAFLKRHMWKAVALQENLQARLGLLFSQSEVLRKAGSDYLEKVQENEQLQVQLESLRADVANAAHNGRRMATENEELKKENEELVKRTKYLELKCAEWPNHEENPTHLAERSEPRA